MEKYELVPSPLTMHKNELKMDHRPNIKLYGENFCDLRLDKKCSEFYKTHKAWTLTGHS